MEAFKNKNIISFLGSSYWSLRKDSDIITNGLQTDFS